MKREHVIASARIAGYHNDAAEFTRLVIEGRVARHFLNDAWKQGIVAKASGMGCHCYQCKSQS